MNSYFGSWDANGSPIELSRLELRAELEKQIWANHTKMLWDKEKNFDNWMNEGGKLEASEECSKQ